MIPVQNIYYMLSYAFRVLNEQGYKEFATEPFANVADLCAAILEKGVSTQIRQGLHHEYITQTDTLTFPRGRIEISESIKTKCISRKQLVCSYDNFSVNSYLNQIIKTTLILLLRADIKECRKKEGRKLLAYFKDVTLLDVHTINWHHQYNRNNQTYHMLISICYLVIKGLLHNNSEGTLQLMDFFDEQHMHQLYERFIREYYRKEFPTLSVGAVQIPWALDCDTQTLLPIMQSDITITDSSTNTVLIIDAKYYEHNTQLHYEKHSIHSNNLYQIFTYVKNKEATLTTETHKVSGVLLYAKTNDAIQPNNVYQMSGNKISVLTLDLNCNFAAIKNQLNQIILDHFELSK